MLWLTHLLFEVNGQLLRLQLWDPSFNVDLVQVGRQLLWVHLPGLGLQYWEEDLLFSMCKALGRPIGIDRNTMNKIVGKFARVQVEMVTGGRRPDEIMVKQMFRGQHFLFKQMVEYEDPSMRCFHCGMYGHRVVKCPRVGEGKTQQNSEDGREEMPRHASNQDAQINPSDGKLVGRWADVVDDDESETGNDVSLEEGEIVQSPVGVVGGHGIKFGI
ncbi:hypothetical protein NE237_011005 [Protea cynaroides]|uniref:CCHC-type domain-containing protein n=1 Tax=Protea cynaroides TaxID=273540 RepID=A0A9Q0L0V6_9MAGN|nr:hypothetical protein NE237_011005 [Protea cynaroides]